ncbi:MAG TPA: hypothetical protein GXZ61_00250 [Clostridiales bacterium]|jgi:TorA maturation chaperone TorD|nr:hypothetical protein [Clostridiales bacterium]
MSSDNASKYQSILQELYAICTDSENKPSDRIAAAKLLLDYIKENSDSNEIRVVFDGIEQELSE